MAKHLGLSQFIGAVLAPGNILPKTNSPPLKNDGLKTIWLPFWSV